jgi:hypothetical protein
MTTQKFVLATIVGGVTLFILGGIFYGLLLEDFMVSNSGTATGTMKAEAEWLYLALGEFVFAALLTTVIGKWAGTSGAGSGLQVGVVFGLLLGVSLNLTFLGVMNISTPTGAIVDVIVGTIRAGAAGAVIGIVLGRK